jgi:uncharacterized protein
MACETIAPRLRRLPTAELLGREVPIATGSMTRLLGLAYLDREEAGAGLLIPRCFSVHTFGMRFALDIVFLDHRGIPLSVHRNVCRRRFIANRQAAAVLELPQPVEGIG